MLEQLNVRNFALSDRNEIEFAAGLTAITGETGAGKSLTVDALSQVLGARADTGLIRRGADRAEVEAVFSLEDGGLQDFLLSRELSSEDGTLVLRRVITQDGKSRAYLNSHAVTLSLLKEVAAQLVSVHGQHASIRLLDTRNQLRLLDGFGSIESLAAKTAAAFGAYNLKRGELQRLSDEQKQGALSFRESKRDLDELRELELEQGDYEKISASYDELQHGSQTDEAVGGALQALFGDEGGALDIVRERLGALEDVLEYDSSLKDAVDRLSAAVDSLEDARGLLEECAEKSDPQQIEELGGRLTRCHDLARRFGVAPGELYLEREKLEQELRHFLSLKDSITALTDEVRELRDSYEKAALELSEARAAAASEMGQKVSALIRSLAMPDGVFEVQVTRNLECRPRAEGRDDVVFMFSANRGQEPRPLGEVASGGELSRLALAVEVLTSAKNATPTLIFDEVDTGISGRTASAVGELLRTLGHKTQVLTVTHLPQVAAAASSQFLVTKENVADGVSSRIVRLDERGRVTELARMMGGEVVTDATLKSAQELLSHAAS